MTREPSKGLAGIVADYTAISTVNQETNSLLYRGYAVEQLARHCSMEETAWLLWHGELPTAEELDQFRGRLVEYSVIPDQLQVILNSLPTDSHPMDITRTAVSILGNLSPLAMRIDPEGEQQIAERLFAVLPAIVAGIQRRRHGLAPIPPREDLTYSENFLWMSFGTTFPTVVTSAFQTSMILYAEHSFNASTFAARVITSTLSDMYSAVTGAIGALKGPLHGGANEAVMAMFDEIGFGEQAPERAVEWLEQALAEKRKIMGFGHRVYRNGDSRVPMMKGALNLLIDHFQRADIAELYGALEEAMVARKGIHPNLDYPSGPAYHLMGFDTPVFTPLFVASRVTGWCAHVMEQRQSNALIRPLSEYNGPPERSLSTPYLR